LSPDAGWRGSVTVHNGCLMAPTLLHRSRGAFMPNVYSTV
jgi:hypothetical protein